MMKARFVFASLAMLVALCAMRSVARAFDGCCPGSCRVAPACGCSGSLDGLDHIPVSPYNALHRPVYRGERYSRSHGESPLVRSDDSSRPHRIQAQVIINPFVSPPAAAPAPRESKPVDAMENKGQTTIGPQIIINPFYQLEAKVACRE